VILKRRELILGAGAALAGCDRLNRSDTFRSILTAAEPLTMNAQRLAGRDALAREFTRAELSPYFRPNGTRMPSSPEYQAQLANRFAGWRLTVDGLVARPLSLPLATLAGLPQRRQITRHDCVEGWSAIGEWQGPQLGPILRHAGLQSGARYIVFHCADSFGPVPYYESIDLVDAFHPQTILALRLNGRPLPVENGAPVRLRVERQLGYKHAKYVMRIEARARLDDLHGGRGGYWEDRSGYQWYAGI
jgi:DMSO/TMAO reductase YedYZ molybdopterin-dependent catalytic subunit